MGLDTFFLFARSCKVPVNLQHHLKYHSGQMEAKDGEEEFWKTFGGAVKKRRLVNVHTAGECGLLTLPDGQRKGDAVLVS